MAANVDEVLKAAQACAARVDLPRKTAAPTLEDVEGQCEDEYAHLLALLQDDEVLGTVDLDEQQRLADQISRALPEARRPDLVDLLDHHMRTLWVQQEAAYYVGLAVGMRIGARRKAAGAAPEPPGGIRAVDVNGNGDQDRD